MRTADAGERRNGMSADGAALGVAVPMLTDYLDDIAARLHQQLGSVAGVAVTVNVDHVPVTVGSSNRLALDTDLLQYEVGMGPCLHALSTGEGMYVPDLAQDYRWGDYGPRAAALGSASCVSVPVKGGDHVVGVLKVYAGDVEGITPGQQQRTERVAVEIAGGIRLAHQLTEQAAELDDRKAAMATRRVIDLAIGILMERNQITDGAAFDLTRRYSQHYNLKLHDAAQQIVSSVAGSAKPFGSY